LNRVGKIDCFGFTSFHQCLSVFICGSISAHCVHSKEKIAASVPSQGVVLGWNRSAALHGGATGGMSADILLARDIAAAKARRQSL
jgi:hypothetical protein